MITIYAMLSQKCFTISILVGVVGFEPTHLRTDLQSAVPLQLHRTPIRDPLTIRFPECFSSIPSPTSRAGTSKVFMLTWRSLMVGRAGLEPASTHYQCARMTI